MIIQVPEREYRLEILSKRCAPCTRTRCKTLPHAAMGVVNAMTGVRIGEPFPCKQQRRMLLTAYPANGLMLLVNPVSSIDKREENSFFDRNRVVVVDVKSSVNLPHELVSKSTRDHVEFFHLMNAAARDAVPATCIVTKRRDT
jgi:hypothetical protein